MNGLLSVIFATHAASAHTARPALLQLTERPDDVAVTWTVARMNGRQADLTPVFPDRCTQTAPPVRRKDASADRSHFTLDCGTAALAGETIRFTSVDSARPDVVVRWTNREGEDRHLVVHPGDAAVTLPLADASAGLAVADYLPSGMAHILEGWDHLAFVTGLVLVVGAGRRRLDARRLLTAVTGFTIGHSLTLAPAAVGFVSVPSGATEACIALSILYLAVELARPGASAQTALVFRRPALVATVCGLLHGLGFAGALAEVGLPEGAVVGALALFNVGVELGQLLFVGVFAVMWAAAARLGTGPAFTRAVVWLLGITSAFWTIERAFSVFTSPFLEL